MTGANIFSNSFFAFGSTCDVVLPGLNPEEAKKLLQQIKNTVSRIELLFSLTEPLSEINQINRLPKNDWIKPSAEFWDLLIICHDFYQMSNGALDISYAPLFSAWENGKNITEDDVLALKAKCGFDKVELDEKKTRFKFLEDEMAFDFSLFQKAYVLDVLKEELKSTNVENCIISFDEGEILALGAHPAGDAWPLGIRNMDEPNEFLHVLEASDKSVVNAGTVEMDFENDKVKNRRLISPESGFPLEQKMTVSVLSQSALMASFIANSWCILPENDKEIITGQINNIEILEVNYTPEGPSTKHTVINETRENE